jgi:hypothetical protein
MNVRKISKTSLKNRRNTIKYKKNTERKNEQGISGDTNKRPSHGNLRMYQKVF